MRIFRLCIFGVSIAVGCGPAPDAPTADADEALQGGISYGGQTCDSGERQWLDDVYDRTRVALASRAFEGCVTRTMQRGYNGAGPYKQCRDATAKRSDPFFGQSIDQQIDGVLAATRTLGDLTVACSGAAWDSTAQAHYGNYFASDAESLMLSDHVFWVWSYASMKIRNDKHGLAGILVHEALHQQGYTHDDCANQSSYSRRHNSVPYITQWCLRDTLNKSESCNLSCGGSGRAIVINSDTDRCECVYPLDYDALGAIGLDASGDMVERFEPVVLGRPLDSAGKANDHRDVFRYSAESVIAVGQFDGRGGDDLLLRDGRTGDLMIVRRGNSRYERVARWAANARHDDWTLWKSDVVASEVGDVDGDGRDDVIITDAWSMAVIGLDAKSRWRVLRRWSVGSNLGSSSAFSYARGDRVIAIDDFVLDPPGDGSVEGDELAIQKSDGALVILSVDRQGLPWVPVSARPGDSVGRWILGSADRFVAPGRITTEDHAQLLVRDAWAVGVLDMNAVYHSGTDAERSPVKLAYGSKLAFHDWILASDDVLTKDLVADFDGDGRDEILIRNDRALAMIDTVGTGLVFTNVYVTAGTSLAGWRWSPTDVMVAPGGDLDGKPGAEIAISSGWGSGVLRYDRANLTFAALDLVPKRRRIGMWSVIDDRYNNNRVVHAIADLDGDGKRELILERTNTRLRK